MNRSLHIRPPAVAGMFYPADAAELAREIQSYLAPVPATQVTAPKGLIVPHADYVYYGAVAASAFSMV